MSKALIKTSKLPHLLCFPLVFIFKVMYLTDMVFYKHSKWKIKSVVSLINDNYGGNYLDTFCYELQYKVLNYEGNARFIFLVVWNTRDMIHTHV